MDKEHEETLKKLPEIILVDDHNIFRAGMKLLIEHEQLGEVIAEAENGKEFIDLLNNYKPDIVLMDIDMPLMNGIKTTQEALKIYPDLKVMALSMFGDEEFYIDMINAGAKGFVLKSESKKELISALKTITAGDSYFSNELLRKIITNIGSQKKTRGAKKKKIIEFNDREINLLQLLTQGMTTIEISQEMNLSPKTIDVYRSKLISKTNSKNTIMLIIYAIKNNLVKI